MDSSVLSDDSDYDIVSPDASIADLRHAIPELPPSRLARETFNTCTYTAEDIQDFVRKTLGLSCPTGTRTKRLYIDGIFDGLGVRHALQLRQVKMSFPSVWLVVGVFSNETCDRFGTPAVLPAVERCEIVRHCRWVDEVLSDAPCTLDVTFLAHHKIDYVAVEEGATVDPEYNKLRLKGYDEMKKNAVILTRRTTGIANTAPRTPVPSTPVASEPEALAPDFTTHIDVYGIGY
ncbi:cholinephosphate cytidylyltransferase [Mycena alexandri]|uniref:choline-phosphate cytidylyltransferase n=1 Tax=Mycena alexandri TaxID=1745969 RepID=A0AAD6TCN7_9AGAR|nr:cholinephosphate cytidylyltransferase [Mycena alexandri]